MVIFIIFVLGTLQFAAVFYYAIKLIDPDNDKNNIIIALGIGLIYNLIGSIGGLLLGIIPLVAMVMILMNYFDLELTQTIIVIAVLIVANLIFNWILESILL